MLMKISLSTRAGLKILHSAKPCTIPGIVLCMYVCTYVCIVFCTVPYTTIKYGILPSLLGEFVTDQVLGETAIFAPCHVAGSYFPFGYLVSNTCPHRCGHGYHLFSVAAFWLDGSPTNCTVKIEDGVL
jgi:hypothetical protein